jgi:ABC-type bacteriocin/lantibiotic exporter with double-glycine peptidase domain
MSLHLIPGFKQSPSFCGPACLKMILHYYGTEASEEEIGALAKTTLEDGTTNENLLLTAQHYGLDGAWKREGSINDLRAYVEKNTPVIVEWFSTNEVHFSIVVGADEDQIVLLDPEHGERESFSHVEFMSVWFSFSGPSIKTTDGVRLRWMLPLIKKT